ncbi:pyridoxal phosphate-dependent decarboxylase family protein [Rhizobium mesosinicum]|uniref:Aspartate aminotransferase family protein n=1 Tax=Rhizobium mesosinicum TaxID=335017 RepID=A0ABS7GXJ3_9HYPH|nr:aminotransferase class V-fold PLP-dependent enzyme [Rhizobium mesosinicum]MBW9054636.1 aspartate aminotransferase family protein [Rhizobium mesosinicum]
MIDELTLMADADRRAADYIASVDRRRVFPDQAALDALSKFSEELPDEGRPAEEGLALLDEVGSPATVTSNGPRYFGFVVGASLPAAAAADRLLGAWDQGATLFATSPVSATVEEVAAKWVLDILDLPRDSAVGFGTSATACGITCLAAARRSLLKKHGWDLDEDGLIGGPPIKVVVSAKIHIVVLKALRILGFGKKDILLAPIDDFGRVDPDRLPQIDDRTIVCLQAGEVNTGEFDPFTQIIPIAKAAGAWVHVDGAFGLWARASEKHRYLTGGIELADSWTTDGHKWLNTPYDSAMAICRDPDALAEAMNSDAVYASGSKKAQKNLTLEFSRKARGVLIWAALRSLGRKGVAELVERHLSQAKRLATELEAAGFTILNRVVLNQVLVRADDDETTAWIRAEVEKSGEAWFGASTWDGKAAFRLSVSSWRTTDDDITRLIALLSRLREEAKARSR